METTTHPGLEDPMAGTTFQKVKKIVEELHQGSFIDEMTVKWLSQTPNPPRIPVFYTLTKIHKPTPVGRPIVAGNDGPTERISSFVDSLLQPIAKSQKSYLKDTTDFVNFIEKRNLPEDAFLVSLDVASLYTNIPQIDRQKDSPVNLGILEAQHQTNCNRIVFNAI